MGLKIIKGKIVFPSLKREVSLSNPKIQKAKPPHFCVIPMAQHQGHPAIPVVKQGDTVCVGTLIGEPDGDFSAAVHSSVSGTVKNIGLYPHPFLGEALAVEIESDGKDTLAPEIRRRDVENLSRAKILESIRSAGVVELSEPCVPMHLKLASAPPPIAAALEKQRPQPERCLLPEKIHTVILNGTECEPYLVADYLVMMEKAHELVEGAKIVKRVTGAEHVILAAGENSLEAIETVNSKLFSLGENFIQAVRLPAHYPQGESRRLIKDVLSLETESGILILNVATVVAIYEAVKMAKPLYERVVTVTGECLAQPKNLLVRIGTPLQEVIRQCNGFLRKPGRLVMGGLMRGVHQENMNAPVIKGTTALIALPPEDVRNEEVMPCTRCGYCVEACPENLVPSMITLAVEAGRLDLPKEFVAENCTLCGNCSYVCPSKRPMTELMSRARQIVLGVSC